MTDVARLLALRSFTELGARQRGIQVVTSVNGSGPRWQQLFARVFAASTAPAASIRIHDFGATPGVVRLRLEQALEEAGHD